MFRPIRHVFALSSTVLSFAALLSAQSPPLPESIKDRIDVYTASLAKAGELSGTLLMGRAADVVYKRSFGLADFQAGRRIDATTVFSIASVTKPLTGVLAERLPAEGKLQLTDTLSKWIADFPRGNEITIAHLRQHRSGIPHRVTTLDDEMQEQTAETMVRLAARQLLTPGSQNSYSSAGFSVLARVLELGWKTIRRAPARVRARTRRRDTIIQRECSEATK